MENRVCKSLPRLVFSFTAKNSEVQFSQALYKVDQKLGVVFCQRGLLKAMCEIASSRLQKCPQAIVWRGREKQVVQY